MSIISPLDVLDALLNLASETRIKLWLRLRYPDWYIVDEISHGLPLFSRQRIQQILQRECDSQRVVRRRRVTNNPGPNPFEYQVPPNIFTDLDERILERVLRRFEQT